MLLFILSRRHRRRANINPTQSDVTCPLEVVMWDNRFDWCVFQTGTGRWCCDDPADSVRHPASGSWRHHERKWRPARDWRKEWTTTIDWRLDGYPSKNDTLPNSGWMLGQLIQHSPSIGLTNRVCWICTRQQNRVHLSSRIQAEETIRLESGDCVVP